MLLRNLDIINADKIADVHILNGKINAVGNFISTPADTAVISFDDVIAFPGLINSHDHLDFNLFPRLGNRVYNNYVEWGDDIHENNKEIINSVLQIPKQLRIKWGIYKNLINGITTVIDHSLYGSIHNEVITVSQQYHFLHSIQLEKNWKLQLNKPFIKKLPYVIHIGEGTDNSSHNEIDTLGKWNIFKRDIVGVHGIAMNEKQASGFKALVWCPDSNFFLMGKTAPVNKLKEATNIVFGTDSTVSARWSIWDHLKLARILHLVSDEVLFNMLTTLPAELWNLKGAGIIGPAYDADIVIAKRKKDLRGYDAYYAVTTADILLVIHKGNIRLFDAELLSQIKTEGLLTDNFSKIIIDGSVKYIYGDLPALVKEIRYYYKEADFPFEIN